MDVRRPHLTDSELLRRYAHRLEPGRTALIVVDLQNDFCDPGGFYGRLGADVTQAQAAAANMSRFLPTARAAGLLPIFVRSCYDSQYISEAMSDRYARAGFPLGPSGRAALEFCSASSWGQDFYVVRPQPGEPTVTKHRYSAFVDTDLDTVLRSNNIDTLVLGGVATNICVESTLRDGYFRDYHVLLLEDCCGAHDRAMHEMTVRTVREYFGIVTTAADLGALWENMPIPPAAESERVAG